MNDLVVGPARVIAVMDAPSLGSASASAAPAICGLNVRDAGWFLANEPAGCCPLVDGAGFRRTVPALIANQVKAPA
jgi:hypothetical protein